MRLDCSFHVFCAAVRHFDSVSVQNLMERTFLREVLVYEAKELGSYVGDHGFAVWGSEP